MNTKILMTQEILSNSLSLTQMIKKGNIELKNKYLKLKTDYKIIIPYKEIIKCKLKEYKNIVTYIYLKTTNKKFYIFIPRINICNLIIITNKKRTIRIYNQIREKIIRLDR